MQPIYPLIFGVAVFGGMLAVWWLVVQGMRTRLELERVQFARRIGRVPFERKAGRVVDVDGFGPVGVRLRGLLVRAGEPMTVRSLLLRIVGVGGAGAVVGGATIGVKGALLGAVLGAVPVLLVVRAARAREEAIAAQLAEAFDMIGRALHAGHAFPLALQTCGRDIEGPLGQELARVSDRHRLGVDMRECLAELAARNPWVFDLHLFVGMTALHLETGGNLIETLSHLATTVRERGVARAKLRAVTAEVRMSAAILGILPFFVTGVLLWIRPSYLLPLVVSPLGQKLLFAAVLSLCIGALLTSRLMQVEA